jgi:hypothetical protein
MNISGLRKIAVKDERNWPREVAGRWLQLAKDGGERNFAGHEFMWNCVTFRRSRSIMVEYLIFVKEKR